VLDFFPLRELDMIYLLNEEWTGGLLLQGRV